MRTITASEAENNLHELIISTSYNSEPIHILGKEKNAVLVSEEDWKSIQETLYLLSIPGMRESIIEGMKELVD
jgi:antitoxin YefM